MKKSIEYLMQKPMMVNIFIGLIIVVGFMVLSNMRSNFLPSEPVSFIDIRVVYRGASPQELEEEVVNKIEDNLKGLKGIDRVTSSSSESFASIQVELLDDADANKVLQDVNNAVDRITTFPPAVETPVVTKREVVNYTMTVGVVGQTSLKGLKDYAKNIKDDLLLSPKLSQIFISGYPEEEIEVRFRESDLRAYQLTFDEVAQAIQLENIKASGGKIETGRQNVLLRLDNRAYCRQRTAGYSREGYSRRQNHQTERCSRSTGPICQ